MHCTIIVVVVLSSPGSCLIVTANLLLSFPVQDISFQLERFISAMEYCCKRCSVYHKGLDVFPIEVSAVHVYRTLWVDLIRCASVPTSGTQFVAARTVIVEIGLKRICCTSPVRSTYNHRRTVYVRNVYGSAGQTQAGGAVISPPQSGSLKA